MNQENFDKALQAIVVVTAFAEVICGKNFMKGIGKRHKVLAKNAVIEVWIGVHNLIRPYKAINTGNSAFAHSPIVQAESKLIYERIVNSVNPNIPIPNERVEKIISRKVNHICNWLKRR